MRALPTRRRVVPTAIMALGFSITLAGSFGFSPLSSADEGPVVEAMGQHQSDGVTTTYTNSYDAASGAYRTTSVTVAGIDVACNGQRLSLTLEDGSNVALASGTVATIAGTSETVTLSGSGAAADAVAGEAIIIAS